MTACAAQPANPNFPIKHSNLLPLHNRTAQNPIIFTLISNNVSALIFSIDKSTSAIAIFLTCVCGGELWSDSDGDVGLVDAD